jgi:hypothetical protein
MSGWPLPSPKRKTSGGAETPGSVAIQDKATWPDLFKPSLESVDVCRARNNTDFGPISLVRPLAIFALDKPLSRGAAEHSQQLKKAVTHSERHNHVDVTVRLLIHITRRVSNFEQTATAKQRTRGIGTGTGACRCR